MSCVPDWPGHNDDILCASCAHALLFVFCGSDQSYCVDK